MDKKSLMVGNWVYNSLYKKNEQVEAIGGKDVLLEHDCVCGYNDIKPIPLERVHLAKNGFVADEYDVVFTYNDGYEVKVIFDEGFAFEKIDPCIFLKIEFAEKDMTTEIKYVHELQNFMRLFGVDKDIQL